MSIAKRRTLNGGLITNGFPTLFTIAVAANIVGLVDFILHLPNRQIKVLGEFFWTKLIYRNSLYLFELFRASENYLWATNFFVPCSTSYKENNTK